MGGQIGRNCLTVEEMFIIGQMIDGCLGAEGTDLPLFLYGQGKTVQDWSTGYDWL
jgi:hypothetical protein